MLRGPRWHSAAPPRLRDAAVTAFMLTAGLVAHATGGRLLSGTPERPLACVSTDSRSISDGTMFVALVGPRFDGHDFVATAIAQGAAGVLTAREPAASGTSAVILVPDTLTALQRLARDVRRLSGARVVAITGSAGKTTTKEVAADFLASRYRVFRNAGNLNNHVGLPLSLLELRHGPQVAVVELGMNHAGEIRTLVEAAEPEVRVWTNVGDAHLGHFASREAIADAKAELLEGSTSSTLLIANADDPLIVRRVAGFVGRTLTFGEAGTADVRASNVVDHGFDGTAADVDSPAGHVRLTVPLPGRAYLWNVLAAAAVAIEFGVPLASLESHTASLRPVARRGASADLPSGARLIDDSYNASPAAMRAMLAALAATPVRGRRIAVIGDMLELGDATSRLHGECGRAAVAAGVDELVVIGGDGADALAAAAAGAGLEAAHIHRFADSHAAAEPTAQLVRPHDLILVKGSRGTRTDIVADRLKEVG
jgi:UDP-N-acetylmuramoyl-tripeptide--D-alanyl-D-alanine ligase